LLTPQINSNQFDKFFPFHLLLDENLVIIKAGKSMKKYFNDIEGKSLFNYFIIFRPQIVDTIFDQLATLDDLIILKTTEQNPILLRGQIEYLKEAKQLLFIGTPWFQSAEDLMKKQFSIKDFAISDPIIDLLHVLKTGEIVTNEVKELLENVTRQKKEAEKIAQRMNSLFEHATEGIILTNEKSEILLANPAVELLFKYNKGEMLGATIESLIPARFRHAHDKYRHSFHAVPSSRQMGQGRDLYALNKLGEEFPVEISLSHFKSKDELFIIAFIIDITQRKEDELYLAQQKDQLEKVTFELRNLNVELEEKVEERTIILKEALQRLEKSQEELSEALDKEKQLNEIKSRFVAMASHEFRTPLSGMLSSANLLSKYTSTEDQPKRTRHIDKISASIHHLNLLLEDFLSLGKIDEGKIKAHFAPMKLEEVIKNTIYEIEGQLKEGQHIEYINEHTIEIESDEALVMNILLNLLSNAIKFSDNYKKITVTSKKKKDAAIICVEDQGIGISIDDQQHLFSSFFRGKNATNIQGTGLGLHIIKRYLELLEGTITLDSELGKGTKITFTIPIKP